MIQRYLFRQHGINQYLNGINQYLMNLPEDHHRYIDQAAGPMRQSQSASSLQHKQGHDYNGISDEDHHRYIGQTVCPMRHYQNSSSSHFNRGHGYGISNRAQYTHTPAVNDLYNQSSVVYTQQNQMPRPTRKLSRGYGISNHAHYTHTPAVNDLYNQSSVVYSQQNQMPHSTREQGRGYVISNHTHPTLSPAVNNRCNQTVAIYDSTYINPLSSYSYGASSIPNVGHGHSMYPQLNHLQPSAMLSQANPLEAPYLSSAFYPSHANEKGYPMSSSHPIAKSQKSDAANPLKIKSPRIAHPSLPDPNYCCHDDLPRTIQIKRDAREIYMYMFHFKSQTSSLQATSITGEENMLISSLLKVNDFAIRDRISPSTKGPDPKRSYQKIMLIRCRGMNKSPPTCRLQFLLIRTEGKLGFYVRMMNCQDASCHNIKHLVGCIASKIKASPNLIRKFDESGSGKDNKALHALFENTTHSSANKKLRKAFTDRTYQIKKSVRHLKSTK